MLNNQRISDKRNRPAKVYYLNTKKSPIGTPQMGCNSPCRARTESVTILITV